jgi:hypothetical protein
VRAPTQKANPPAARIPRLAVSRAEAAESLGVSIDYLDEHVLPEVRIVRRGRRKLIPVYELERWLRSNAALALERASQR